MLRKLEFKYYLINHKDIKVSSVIKVTKGDGLTVYIMKILEKIENNC